MSQAVNIKPDEDGNDPLFRPTGSNAKGHETLTVSSASAGGFLTIPAGARQAYISCETAQIRFWVDGTLPTSTTGHVINIGDSFRLDSAGQIANFKAIGISASATLQITYF